MALPGPGSCQFGPKSSQTIFQKSGKKSKFLSTLRPKHPLTLFRIQKNKGFMSKSERFREVPAPPGVVKKQRFQVKIQTFSESPQALAGRPRGTQSGQKQEDSENRLVAC